MFLSHFRDVTGNAGFQLVSWYPINVLTGMLESFNTGHNRMRA